MNKLVVLLLIFVAANPHVMFAQKTVWITQALKMGMKRFVFRKGPGLYRWPRVILFLRGGRGT